MRLKLYVVTYQHEFGVDVRLLFADHWPEPIEAAEFLGIDFYPGTEDLYISRLDSSSRVPVLRSWSKGPKVLPLKKLGTSLVRNLPSKRGASSIEYALIVTGLSIAAVLGYELLGASVRSLFEVANRLLPF